MRLTIDAGFALTSSKSLNFDLRVNKHISENLICGEVTNAFVNVALVFLYAAYVWLGS